MKPLRTVLFWAHLLCGVIGGVAILIMSATGAILAFKPQIQAFIERDVRTVQIPVGGQPRLGAQAMLAQLREDRPDAQVVSVTLTADRAASAAVALGRVGNAPAGTVYVDPYSGRLLGAGSQATTAFFRSMENWHRWLAVSTENRATGRAINDASNLAFLLLAISGLYLWWPRTWLPQHLNPILWFKRTRTGRARDFNWHNVIGFWCAPILIVLTATGVVISYTWATNLVYRMAGSPVPAPRAAAVAGAAQQAPARGEGRSVPAALPDNLDALWARAEQQLPEWSVIIMRLPNRAGMATTFSIGDAREWNSFGRSTLTVDSKTAEVTKWEPYANNSLGQRLRQWARFSHTGELGRWPGQALAGIACVGGVVLVWTGLALAWRRLLGWRFWRRFRSESPSFAPRDPSVVGTSFTTSADVATTHQGP